MREILEAIVLVLVAGAVMVGAPIAGGLFGTLAGIGGTVLLFWVVLKMIREESKSSE